MANNKVKYNLKNAHYALLNIGDDGAITYEKPVSIPGAVSISLDANGEPENFYADGIAYYFINNNMGYDGDLELALIPESFRIDVLREELDENKVLIENSGAEIHPFALLFEFDGDVRHIRHVLYNCSASRPGIQGKTNEETREVQTETLSLKASPLPGGVVKAKTGNTTDESAYANWYNDVYMPGNISGKNMNLATLTIGNISLEPEFSGDITSYEATTNNATNAITATAVDKAAGVAINVNGNSISSGSSATWDEGKNQVVITVTNAGSSKRYVVNVTKE